MQIEILTKLGFSDKDALVYTTLLRLGSSSVRKLAEATNLNRGSVYETLKWLQERELVNLYDKDGKQHFVAEDPEHLLTLVKNQKNELEEVALNLNSFIPELKALHSRGGDRPVSRYFEHKDLRRILEDVLTSCEYRQELLYRIYSPVALREYLYDSFPEFSNHRIAKHIAVKVVAIGEGGELRGLDERKWLKSKTETPTYIIIYPGKTAYISLLASGEPMGVVIENEGVFQTQKAIFDELWKTL